VDGLRLRLDLLRRRAHGDVRQREHAGAGLEGDLGGLAGGGVLRLAGAFQILIEERGLVDEQVAVDVDRFRIGIRRIRSR
jgi:hypothetical protein